MSAGSLIATIAAALVLAAAGTPLARRAAFRFGVLDPPSPRKLHRGPMPLLGGLALWVSVIGALLLVRRHDPGTHLAGILVAASWVALWGLWDDRRALPASVKLMAQLVAVALVVFAGVQVRLPLPDAANLAVTLLWFVGVTNAFNLLDNMDGVAGGVGAVAAASFMLLSAFEGDWAVAATAAALLGACVGFLFHNLDPARIFMGDSGSMFLGFLVAALGVELRFPDNTVRVTWMVPVLVLGVPIFDTTLVVVSRLRAGRNPFTTPGQDHLSHRLAARGLSCRQVVSTLCVAGAGLGGLAWVVSRSGPAVAYTLAGLTFSTTVGCLVWLERKSKPLLDASATSR